MTQRIGPFPAQPRTPTRTRGDLSAGRTAGDGAGRPADATQALGEGDASTQKASVVTPEARPAGLLGTLGDFRHWVARRSPVALSIRWRLSLWYTLILAVMLMAFSLIVYWYMGTSLSQDLHRSSVERALQVQDVLERQIVEVGPYPVVRDGEVVPVVFQHIVLEGVLDPFKDPGVGVRVMDWKGRVQAGSAQYLNNDERIPINHVATSGAIANQSSHAEVQNTEEGSFYVYTRPAFTEEGTVIGAIQIVTSREPYRRTMDRLASLLGAGTLLAVLLAWGMGVAMAHTALSPIDSITRTARRINRAQDLSRRVAVTGPRDEVGRLSDTVNEMLDRIESMFERQRQFLADVSHELRTPLTTIRGEVELMERTGELEPEALQAMKSEAERMSRLVSDLLLLARADTGLELHRQPMALDELAVQLHRHATTLAADHHTVCMDAIEPVTVLGDGDRLKQLGLILIDNAIKHTPPGSEVSIAVSSSDGNGILVISDSGPGMDRVDLERIFDRFYRVDKARSRASGGSGLGLSIARWIVTAHGGDLNVQSAPGEGTTFTVSLPEAATMTNDSD